MRLYLDLNCFNRPFDDQDQTRIANETEAVFIVLQRIEEDLDQMVWSAVLEFENSQHPLVDRRDEISQWADVAKTRIVDNKMIADRARELVSNGFGTMDAVHLASAESGRCNYFLTCDDRLLRRASRTDLTVVVQNPVDYVEALSDV